MCIIEICANVRIYAQFNKPVDLVFDFMEQIKTC